ncbi:hypothetical protein IQ06DRAFT_336526 [Phaeosphaeriaceae sp. SRC1lsM3a]|nr:hypothetical protein IQ06DRAFT_336526 [Stagonospora sp. SRC1lsM3a]
MGWLKALRNDTTSSALKQNRLPCNTYNRLKPDSPEVSHIEDVLLPTNASSGNPRFLSFASLETSDAELPLLSAAEVASSAANHVYIVVDNIVYNCTQFVEDHPGGRQVIESFRGQECSWQFWRFHSAEIMRQWGRPLRIAQTTGVKNKWKEMPRYVGLKKLGAEEED